MLNKNNIFTLFFYTSLVATNIILSFVLKNLFLQFFVVVVLLFSLYNVIIFIIYSLIIHSVKPKLFFPNNMQALSESTLQLIFPRTFVVLPCVCVRLKFVVGDVFSDFTIQKNLEFCKNKTKNNTKIGKVDFMTSRHGEFSIAVCTILINTFFSINSFKFNVKCDKKVVINPPTIDKNEFQYNLTNGDDCGNYKHTLQNSTDLFDNRKYYVGDDPRKINWKVYAHFNELQIRQPEKISTNFGNQNIVFVPFSLNLAEYETITAVFVKLCEDLLKNDVKLNVFIPNRQTPIVIDKTNESKLSLLINNSYYPIQNIALSEINDAIIIGSINQLCEILEEQKNSYSCVYTCAINNEININEKIIFCINKSRFIIQDLMLRNKHKKDYEITKKQYETVINSVDGDKLIVV